MRRTGFKRKPTVPMKRTKLHKQGTQKISVLKRKLWEVFSKYIRTRDKGICFTCGRKCDGKGYHAGHFVPKSVGGLYLYFHEDNVHGQCYHCNINLGGNQYVYSQKLGQQLAEELYSYKHKSTKISVEEYIEKIEFYKNKLFTLA